MPKPSIVKWISDWVLARCLQLEAAVSNLLSPGQLMQVPLPLGLPGVTGCYRVLHDMPVSCEQQRR